MDMVTVTGAFSLWIFTAAKNHEIASHISEVQSDPKQKWYSIKETVIWLCNVAVIHPPLVIV